MNEKPVKTINWYDILKDEHIDAAIEYLNLFFKKDELEKVRDKLEKHKKDIVRYKAKDLLRGSELTPLPQQIQKSPIT